MTKVIFVQPFTVNAALAEQCEGRTVVLDVAFNAGSPAGKGTPEEQFKHTTVAFIESLGDRLALWLDHHPHHAWGEYADDPRFILVPRGQAPACPPLVTPELVSQVGEVDTIVAHGDFDGIMSAIKYLNGGKEAYPYMDADSIAADSRVGEMSEEGKYYESALKADLSDDAVRQAIVTLLLPTSGQDGYDAAYGVVSSAAEKYAAVQEATLRLVNQFNIDGNVAYVDATDAAPFDLTALLLAGQKMAPVAVVRNTQRGNIQITVAGPREWNFVDMFGLTGGMPNRVNLPDGDVQAIIDTINQ